MPFLDDIIWKLQQDNVGTIGTNIFESSKAVIPKLGGTDPTQGAGPFLAISETGGVAPTRIQNKAAANTQRPTAQIVALGVSQPLTRALSSAAYFSLDGLFNVTLNGTFYLRVVARQEPTDMGLDATAGRIQFTFNVEAEKQPS